MVFQYIVVALVSPLELCKGDISIYGSLWHTFQACTNILAQWILCRGSLLLYIKAFTSGSIAQSFLRCAKLISIRCAILYVYLMVSLIVLNNTICAILYVFLLYICKCVYVCMCVYLYVYICVCIQFICILESQEVECSMGSFYTQRF